MANAGQYTPLKYSATSSGSDARTSASGYAGAACTPEAAVPAIARETDARALPTARARCRACRGERALPRAASGAPTLHTPFRAPSHAPMARPPSSSWQRGLHESAPYLGLAWQMLSALVIFGGGGL